MSRRGQKTPARVQVFFFEKKQPGRPTRSAPEAEAPTEPKRPKRLTAEQVQRRANARTASHRAARAITRAPDPSRRTTEKVLAAAPEPLHERETEPEIPCVDLPAGSRSGALEALEYHRLKLQEMTARGQAPRAAANLALYGHALYARGRLDDAQVVFESLVSREPEEAFAYTMLGAVYLAQDDDARALALFDAALAIEEGDLAALVGRGEIRLRRGQPKLALQDLEKAIAGDPGGRDPFSERARALSVLARTLARALR